MRSGAPWKINTVDIPRSSSHPCHKWVVRNARRNNLQGVDATFLVGALNVVTGVSGAGKSSLVQEAIDQNNLMEPIHRVVVVDQTPIGRTPRSNLATYIGLWDGIRQRFAADPSARARGLGANAFSFNVAGGRCEACEGAGVHRIDMRWLGKVDARCEVCHGKRFGPETLEVRLGNKNVREVLDLTVDEARAHFSDVASVDRMLSVVSDLGLGYLALGQPAPTF